MCALGVLMNNEKLNQQINVSIVLGTKRRTRNNYSTRVRRSHLTPLATAGLPTADHTSPHP